MKTLMCVTESFRIFTKIGDVVLLKLRLNLYDFHMNNGNKKLKKEKKSILGIVL